MNKNELIHSGLIRPVAKLLVPKNKRQFRLLDDPNCDNWNEYIIHREKVTINDDKLLLRDIGGFFLKRIYSLNDN